MAGGDTTGRNMLQIVLDLVKSEIGHIQRRIDAIEKRIDDSVAATGKDHDLIIALTSDLSSLKAQYEALKTWIKNLNDKINDIDKIIADKVQAVADLQAESRLNGKTVAANSGIAAAIIAAVELIRYLATL